MSPWEIVLACAASGAWGMALATWATRCRIQAAKATAADQVHSARIDTRRERAEHEAIAAEVGRHVRAEQLSLQGWYRLKILDILSLLDSGSRKQVEVRCRARLTEDTGTGPIRLARVEFFGDEPEVKS